jgi:hypothetical protein
LSRRFEMARDGTLPLNPSFTLLSPLRSDADAHAKEAYLPCLYPSNEVLPRQELDPSYWMERRSRTRLLSKYRSFDIFYGIPGAIPADNKNVLGASLASISSVLAEKGSDEYDASQDIFEYTTIDPLDPLVRDTLVQSSTEEIMCLLGSDQTASPKAGSSETRQTGTSSESNVKTHVRETSLMSPGIQIAVTGDRPRGVSRPIRAPDRIPCPFPACREYSRTAFCLTLSSASLQAQPFATV